MNSAPTSPPAAWNAGKLAVASILAMAIALAGFAWYWNWQRTQKCREFYGGEGAHLIRTATRVEGLMLSGLYDAESREQIEIGPHAFEVVGRRDLSKANGLIHARTALLDDSSYKWDDSTTGDCQPLILYAVRFREEERLTTLAFDFGCRQVWVVETQKNVTLAPKIAGGWESFLKRQMNLESQAAPQE
jgi:hypothetical protein